MLLLDTHVLLWWLDDSPKLPQEVRLRITDPDNMVFVSAATLWEIAIKRSIGKLIIPHGYLEAIDASNFTELPITWEHARATEKLPLIHRDPFDRMLVTQAIHENLTIATTDKNIALYDVRVCPPSSSDSR